MLLGLHNKQNAEVMVASLMNWKYIFCALDSYLGIWNGVTYLKMLWWNGLYVWQLH